MQLFYFDPKFPLGLNTALQLDWGLDIKYLPAKFFCLFKPKDDFLFFLRFLIGFLSRVEAGSKKVTMQLLQTWNTFEMKVSSLTGSLLLKQLSHYLH